MGSESLKYKFHYDRTELNKCLLCCDPECTEACVGCHLCLLVCPEKAIRAAGKSVG